MAAHGVSVAAGKVEGEELGNDMHYKNGREAKLGDWVVGISHNSNGKPICGLVVDLMPRQEPCNIKIHVWDDEYFTEEGNPVTIHAVKSRGKEDYGDATAFIRVDDGLRMVSAVTLHGNWDSPYNAQR